MKAFGGPLLLVLFSFDIAQASAADRIYVPFTCTVDGTCQMASEFEDGYRQPFTTLQDCLGYIRQSYLDNSSGGKLPAGVSVQRDGYWINSGDLNYGYRCLSREVSNWGDDGG